MNDRSDARYLGAIRFVSAASGLPIEDASLQVEAEGLALFRNRRGLYVVARATGFDEVVARFDEQQPAPARPPFTGTVIDRTGRFLARRFTVALPRDPDPEGHQAEGSLFQPLVVPLYLAPHAAVPATWSLLRARLVDGARRPVAGALVRVTSDVEGVNDAEGMSQLRFDPRVSGRTNPTAGEVLVAVPSIPLTRWGAAEGQVVLPTVPVRLEVRYVADAGDIPNPATVAAAPVRQAQPVEFEMETGRTCFAGEIEVVLPP